MTETISDGDDGFLLAISRDVCPRIHVKQEADAFLLCEEWNLDVHLSTMPSYNWVARCDNHVAISSTGPESVDSNRLSDVVKDEKPSVVILNDP